MAPFHFIGQDNDNQMQCAFSGHVTPFAPASYDANGTIAFVYQANQNEVQHDIFGHVMYMELALASCDADGFITVTTAFVNTR